jgi:DNA helicase-2/ATP-dependent DNA helicase PcrA
MQNTDLLAGLNPAQAEAVSAPAEHLLVLAGAGSGKTRVLVHRMAWLIQTQGWSPMNMLSVTFTNKAAMEMRQRTEALCQQHLNSMWAGTFHGLAHRMLRRHHEDAHLPEQFQIIDSDDQLRLIKRIHRQMNLDETKWPPKQSQWYINQAKESGRRARDLAGASHYFEETMAKIYTEYESVCQRSGLVDFGELLLRSLELLEQAHEIRTHYQSQFRIILVDEFQDTNVIQYRWLKQLAGEHTCIMAVGDDDQSIYSWRGAKVENMHRFLSEFDGARTIRLEQNYRSTKTILSAANAVIDHNSNRMGKSLWTAGAEGEPITLYAAFNERDEAHYIGNAIKTQLKQGSTPDDIAILYRSNAQSRVLEERLIDLQIAYRIYGGQKFFDRMEIKDALAYLRLIDNPHDDAAFERVINTPTRGIGQTTLTEIRGTAHRQACSLWAACESLIEAPSELSSRARQAVNGFLQLITHFKERITGAKEIGEHVDYIIRESGLLAHCQKDRSEKGLSRVENLSELVNACTQFTPQAALTPEQASTDDALRLFLSHVALESGDTQADAQTQCVSLMTLHAAKGLEFPIVFITGMEEDLFPHKMASEQPSGLEEERRLCYVGMTRAMARLYLTYAESRRLHGYERYHRPSRFLSEMPEEYITRVRPTATRLSPEKNSSFAAKKYAQQHASAPRPGRGGITRGEATWSVGQRVTHPKFGQGTIINYEGAGETARLQIQFQQGTKWLALAYAKIQAVK